MSKNPCQNRPVRYRVWIAAFCERRPEDLAGVPPEKVATEPAEKGTMSARQAARYVRAFNRVAVAGGRKVRAVALPVRVLYDGEPRPGQKLDNVGGDPH